MARFGTKFEDSLALGLAAGLTVEDAAERAGVSRRTAFRRLTEPGFRNRVSELRSQMVGRALGRMADGMSDAADKLRQLLNAESESVCLGAARALLELGAKLRDSVELEQRILTLEEMAKHE